MPPRDAVDESSLLEGFLAYVESKKLELYPAQEEAILELFAGANVILNTPTGSGKSLVAAAAQFKALAERKRSYYTAPIKALVSEKFFALCRDLGAENVGMMTGDATVNRDAPILCCTAEILANLALRDGEQADVDQVIMDEFHYYADRERGVAWQVPLLTLPRAQFLLMSATIGDTAPFEAAINELTKNRTVVVKSTHRPVPLEFLYRETPLHETIADLLGFKKAPVYVVHFTQRAAIEEAQNLTSVDILTKDQKASIDQELKGFRFQTPFGKDLKRYLKHGIGVHHAGLLPKYRLLVEKLAQKGLLKVICGTDTLGVGVNIPLRTVLFTQLCKYDGEKTAILSVRDFKQIAGRAGRKGFDDEGTVVAQAPEHVVENRSMEMKAAGDAKKMRKLVRKKPPDKGYAHWDESTFRRLISSEPERLSSQFSVSQGMLLQVLGRAGGNGCAAMKSLVRRSHDGPTRKHKNGRLAIGMFRSLVSTGVVEMKRGEPLRINEDLQQDFSLNQALSLYALETIPLLDKESPDYAVDVLTLVEAILEDPTTILLKQLDELKGIVVNDLKAQGVEYEERMAELEKLEYPKPRRDFVYESFNAFAERHPWVGAENVRPKSVARDLYERGETFNGYVRTLGLERAEGVLLRYLTDAYKAMVQNVPEAAKTPEVYDVTELLGAVVKSIDSSLLDEWERIRSGVTIERETLREEELVEGDITRDKKAFTVLVRNELFRLVKMLAGKRFDLAASMVVPTEGEKPWSSEEIAEKLEPYFAEHAELRIDATARSPRNVTIDEHEQAWYVRQTLVDPEETLGWALETRIDLARAREEQRPILELLEIKSG